MNKFICTECGTKYQSPELTPPPGIKWGDGHVCTPKLVDEVGEFPKFASEDVKPNPNVSSYFGTTENITPQQEEKLKLQSKKVVEDYIKSYGDNPKDYDEVFYNKKGNIGLNVITYLEEFAFDILSNREKIK